jgi:hypothetical protein
LMTSQRMRCPPTHLLMRPPTTRTLDVTATESGTNSVNVLRGPPYPEPQRGSGSSCQSGTHHSWAVPLLMDKTHIHLRSASVRSYTFFTTGIL